MQVIKPMTLNNTNAVNPISHDAVGVRGSGTTTRFKTDSTGPLAFHCRIFWHKFAGLASVQSVDPVDFLKNVQVTPAWEGLYPAWVLSEAADVSYE
ncbi:multicopper oxidase [Macrolepiota fuliginosa MF-IS2]|uniref:Multicopper oxidase n=1 Tax=Macrolepiota fuliginosa MF-IS2 TaxID=1400762 RepID=A0A9P6BY76_9AGAR|nr:multicopper oxidase [Macrolepiota fuliginosa MF-IS2]